ncbi:methylenetetrahydrofolate reductase [Geobacter sulfurreducens]|uniref:Methylenetetrahydrofolate reductase n=1 Tax=Geobacter sulfurreducens (strain ATCC 51573 / DSM 12127 / PCA) TaxID=243231 RepID=Q74EU9_GEOSL|nr:methylenetetrahydrofolate reductase [Geobacter sulfurreducens]AAR34190.1 5,10-methylenetetrahydrofolate reductase [Geobacter sulfurreducens PCA]ADI83704.1 5,10-methylenetetrahydrofolate reductase [Geobacter sulfurreducens KN400]AJY70600.1 methylenetetrahydrofolate reductase [Geobacter sulfurreducens]UAC04918.1 methylenetetrahydrofolate reductase [Geobacter sulfurreducens]HBB69800.1 5,10-methylenetetrahydrofolate reductase [Geobacter sulfurreducens]
MTGTPSSLSAALAAGHFVVTTEICPPKGSNCTEFLRKARALRQAVDAVNVTDNQGANMRISPLAPAALLVREGIEPILQLTCRDRNRMALQSELLAASALGITNVLALTGDFITFGDHREAKPVFDLDSVQLLRIITGLNEGRDLSRTALTGATSFFAGAAAAPEAEPFALTLSKLAKKAAAGARFLQTQAVFSPERFARFADATRPLGMKIIAGILLLKSPGMARYVTERVPGLKVPPELVAELESASDPLAAGVEIARRTVAAVRPFCDGVHIMAMGREDLVPAIVAGVERDSQEHTTI